MLDKAVVTQRLKTLHIEAQEAARRAGMSKQQWSNMMIGNGNVRAETLYRIAAALECAPCDLLIDGKRKPKSS